MKKYFYALLVVGVFMAAISFILYRTSVNPSENSQSQSSKITNNDPTYSLEYANEENVKKFLEIYKGKIDVLDIETSTQEQDQKWLDQKTQENIGSYSAVLNGGTLHVVFHVNVSKLKQVSEQDSAFMTEFADFIVIESVLSKVTQYDSRESLDQSIVNTMDRLSLHENSMFKIVSK